MKKKIAKSLSISPPPPYLLFFCRFGSYLSLLIVIETGAVKLKEESVEGQRDLGWDCSSVAECLPIHQMLCSNHIIRVIAVPQEPPRLMCR